MTSRVQLLAVVTSFVAGTILYGLGIVDFTTGSYADYPLRIGSQFSSGLFVGILVAAAILFSGSLTCHRILRSGPIRTSRGPPSVWAGLVISLSVISLGTIILFAAPVSHCNPPLGILWPTYCGGAGPSTPQTLGAFLVLVGSITGPGIVSLCLSTRYLPLPIGPDLRSQQSAIDGRAQTGPD